MRQRSRLACQSRPRKSKFVDIFRTTPVNTVCPNFYVLAHADGCSFAPQCSYCYLKSSFWYLRAPQVFTNLDKMVAEIKAWLARDELESYVLSMGNLSDSLVFEEARPLIGGLVELFREESEAKGRKHTLLLVTKRGKPLVRLIPFEGPPRGHAPGKLAHTLVFEKDIVSPG